MRKLCQNFIVGCTFFIFVFILQVLDCLTELMEQMEMYKTKVHDFEMKLKEEAHTQREMLDETQTFRARLQECQVIVGGNIDYAMCFSTARLYNILFHLYIETSTRCMCCRQSSDGNIWAAGHEFESCTQLDSGAFTFYTEPLVQSTAEYCSELTDSRGWCVIEDWR